VSHPRTDALVALHFGECPPHEAERLRAHAAGCAECGALLADLALVDSAAFDGTERPPVDGLERVLERLSALPAARPRRAGWRAAVPSAAAIAGLASAVHLGGASAALVFFAAGALVTLSLAPMLILESRAEREHPSVR
jgi:hypothetical protein